MSVTCTARPVIAAIIAISSYKIAISGVIAAAIMALIATTDSYSIALKNTYLIAMSGDSCSYYVIAIADSYSDPDSYHLIAIR